MDFKLDFFSIVDRAEPRLRKEIELLGKIENFPSNTIVYEQFTSSTSVYLIIQGVVEAATISPDGRRSRNLAYMRRGDFFGELGVLIGQKRVATIRTCEDCELLKLSSDDFLRLMEHHATFAVYISRYLARRLHETTSREIEATYGIELSGHLRCFDLLTIFQAISSGNHTGELRLSDYRNNIIGNFFFRTGRVQYAKFVHLEGLEAIWQGFVQSTTEGNFVFEEVEEPKQPFTTTSEINLNASELLLSGVGKRDSYQGLPESLRKMEGRLAVVSPNFAWDEEETRPIAQRLCELCARRPQPLLTLWRRVNYSELTFLETVQNLISLGAAALREENEFIQSGPLARIEASP